MEWKEDVTRSPACPACGYGREQGIVLRVPGWRPVVIASRMPGRRLSGMADIPRRC
jgi:hypothetical protein